MKFLTLFFCFLFTLTHAQTGTIFGNILDKYTKKFIPYATIIVKLDTKTVTGGITDNKGSFSIDKVPLGKYIVEVQFIGYKTFVKPIELSQTNKEINIGSIAIEEDAVALESVEIRAERSAIEQKIDRKVIHVGRDLTTAGASARDIMGNIPSVSVNQDGELSLRGNENVRILVDGKPTNISARDLLRQIPTASIKSIELITNPSAKYNPEGMSGIINIILKKNANLGFNGNFSSGITFGERIRFNSTLSLNYRSGKVNIYGSYGNRFGKQVTDGTVTRFIEGTNQLTKNINENTSHLFKIGADFFFDDRNTFSVYTNQNLFKSDLDGTKAITFFNDLSSNYNQLDAILTDNINSSYNLDFKHDFVEKGHNIELEFDYNVLDSDAENIFVFTGNNPVNNYDEVIVDKRTNTIINLDYANPINENSLLEIGLESRFRRTNNTYITNSLILPNSNFSYDRDIHSFYTTWSQRFSKWQYNLGVRLEDYSVTANFDQIGSELNTFTQNLFNIYPSGFLKFAPDEEGKNAYQLSLSRRIDRPSLNQINPIRQISTPQIIITGNPSLTPQFTNSIELNYNRKLNKGNITFGGFYRRINDEINRIGYFDENDPALLIVDYANFDRNNAFGFEFSSNYQATKWWGFNASFDVYSRTQKGVIEGENVQVNNTLLNAKINNSFKAGENLTFQLFTSYSGPQEILQYELKDNFFMNAGVRYNFAKGNGTFSINFNDIFRTQRFAFETYRTIFQRGEFRGDTQSVFFGFSYRFGVDTNKALNRKKRDKNEKADKLL